MSNNPDIAINNAKIVNEDQVFQGSILIKDQKILDIIKESKSIYKGKVETIDANGNYLLPGIIDDQVHFRQPGLTHKGDIRSESKAAVAGGITSFMEMPNTIPQTTNIPELEDKFDIASSNSLCNYSFYIGATNNNLDILQSIDKKHCCGIKIFMGSSTGNMLVNDINSLSKIFQIKDFLIATHCEDDAIINKNALKYKTLFGDNIPIEHHKDIRSREACFASSALAVDLAKKYNTRLHILHLSTKEEIQLFSEQNKEKRITAEACVHHLFFDSNDYSKLGTKIKWNPSIKEQEDREALISAVNEDIIDIIATDHAPHLLKEKQNSYFNAPSGGPLVQHSLAMMIELYYQGKISLEKIVTKMCHAPADLFNVDKRGYIRKGYWADLILVDMNKKWTVNKNNILYKCNWSPLEGYDLRSKVTHTIVNGHLVYKQGKFTEGTTGQPLVFNR